MRVVYPQFHQFTGHITVGKNLLEQLVYTKGGAICVKELTLSGWEPGFDLSTFFVMIRNLLLEGSALINMDRALYDYTEG